MDNSHLHRYLSPCQKSDTDIGVSVGILAAAIDIVSDWLGDLKEGFCKPTFYLNRGFCCWGISGRNPLF